MSGVGFDCGTYNLVCCQRDKDGNFVYKREVNAFLEIPIAQSRFVFNMMKDAGVPLIENKDLEIAYALGEAAIQMAYAMNQIELRRPMKDGCLNPKEKNAQQIMNIMIHGMLDIKQPNETLFYSKPANAINEETDADYHAKVLEAIFAAYQSDNGYKVKSLPINEGLALIYAELAAKQWTGVGCSWGGGMVNVCFSMFGNPMFEFSLVDAGDWVDRMAAKATGESPAYINVEKMKLNFNENSDSLVQRAIKAQYEIMVQKTISGIKRGLEEAGNKIKTEHPVDIVISGGTSSPPGFENLFKQILDKSKLPIKIGSIIKPKDPLLSVARGCLLAAEAADKS